MHRHMQPQSQMAQVVAQTLWENFLVHYGWPEKILTGQEKPFQVASLGNYAGTNKKAHSVGNVVILLNNLKTGKGTRNI